MLQIQLSHNIYPIEFEDICFVGLIAVSSSHLNVKLRMSSYKTRKYIDISSYSRGRQYTSTEDGTGV